MSNHLERQDMGDIAELNTDLIISIPAEPYLERLNSEAVFRNTQFKDMAAAIINLGVTNTLLGEDEWLSLRNAIGFEETFDLMDTWFLPVHDFDDSINPGELLFKINAQHKRGVINYAREQGIDLEELGGRVFNMGIWAAFETRDGEKRIMKYAHGESGPFNFLGKDQDVSDDDSNFEFA